MPVPVDPGDQSTRQLVQIYIVLLVLALLVKLRLLTTFKIFKIRTFECAHAQVCSMLIHCNSTRLGFEHEIKLIDNI